MAYTLTQTINIAQRCQGIAFKHRAPRAIRTVKDVVERSLKTQKVEFDTVKVDELLNAYIWQQGIRNTPRKVRVSTVVEEQDGRKIATIYYNQVESFKGLKKQEDNE